MTSESPITQERSDVQPTTDHTDLTAFQVNILAVIARHERGIYDEESYGLSIKRALVDLYDEEIYHGRLYPNLNELVDRGLVEKEPLDKRTNGYTLSDAGHHLLEVRAELLLASVGRDAEVVR